MSRTIIHSTLESGYDFYIENKYQKKFHFKISTFDVPSGKLSEALEVVDDKEGLEPYRFTLLGAFDCDCVRQEELLKAKVRRGVDQVHLVEEHGGICINEGGKLAGRIEGDDGKMDTNFETTFVVDGKLITLESFEHLIKSYAGWNFKFEIIDPTDMDFD